MSKKNIEYVEVDLRSPASAAKKTKTIFMLHGYGADAYDLKSLAEILDGGLGARWIFAQGIKSVPIGPGWQGRAWWELSARDLSGGDVDHFTEAIPAGIDELRERMLNFVTSIEPDFSQVIFGGFSQGAMLAMDLFLHAPKTPLGLILLSGALINKKNLKEKLSARKDSSFFLSHGRNDQVLPYKCGSQIESFLLQGGLKGSLLSFEGSHEIPMQVVEAARRYLHQLDASPGA
jgi:phospholipase/carboxylesterase